MKNADVINSASAPTQTVLAGDLRISVLTANLIRVERGSFRDQPTQTVWNRSFAKPEFKNEKRGKLLIIQTESVTFEIKLNGKVTVVFKDGKRVSNFKKGNLLGTARTLDNADGAIPLGQGLISLSGVAVLDDSRSLVLDGEKILPLQSGICDKYYFAYGSDYREALKDFYSLCGDIPLVPKYVLGNWWSRYKAYTQEEYRSLMLQFIQRRIPITVATIDMDWHWVDVMKRFGDKARSKGGANIIDKVFSMILNGWTGYSWNTELFPDYRELLQWLNNNGFEVTLNVHPSQGVRFFDDQYPQMCERMGVDANDKLQISFDLSNQKFISAYFDILHHPFEKEGVGFWWIDWQQGKTCQIAGLDPLWALNHYHYLDSARENHRPVILSRYAGPGSHRYPLGFSGDTIISWRSLRFQPYFTATAANIGYTWWSHDIGGHQRGRKNDELYLRWLQFGVFSPINRLHSTSNEFAGKEPWKNSPEIDRLSVEQLRLRHKMIPFLYSAAYLSHKKGVAICEPLYYTYKEKQAYMYKNEYIFGGQLICAPITEKRNAITNLASAEVWLPEKTRYTDIFTGAVYEGGKTIKMFRSLDSFPCLAKAGTIIPEYKFSVSNDLSLEQPLEVIVYRGTGSFALYEDDGRTDDYQQGQYALSMLTICEQADGYLFTAKWNISGKLVLPEREVTVVFKDIEAAEITVNGEERENEGDCCVQVIINGNAEISLNNCVFVTNKEKREAMIDMVTKYQGKTQDKQKKYLDYINGKTTKPKAKRCEYEPLAEIEQLYYGKK